MRAPQTMTPIDWTLLVALSIVWGGSFFFFKVLVGELPVLTIVLGRVVPSALILLAIVYLNGTSMPASPKIWVAFGIMSIFNNLVPFSLIIWSKSQIQSGVAAILNATSPIFGVLLAHVLVKGERLTPYRIGGVLVALIGVAVLMGPNAIAGLNLQSLAQLGVIGASISYAWVAIYGRRFKELGIPPLVTATGQIAASAVLATPLALTIDRPWTLTHAPSVAAVWALVGLAVLSTVLAYIIYFRILESAGATNVLLVTFITPISALLLGGLVLGERLSSGDALGMLLIFAGLVAIDGRLLRTLTTRLVSRS